MIVAGLVLAAGRATRFGSTKQLATVGGRPLVRIAADTAVAAGLDPVLVVVGHDAPAVAAVLPGRAEAVHNDRFAEGQSTSLRAGLEALDGTDADAVVVLLADEPEVEVATIESVVAALATGAPIVRCRYADRPGHPVGLARAVWAAAAPTTGDAGARALLDGPTVVHVAVRGAAPRDVDRPSDARAVDEDLPR